MKLSPALPSPVCSSLGYSIRQIADAGLAVVAAEIMLTFLEFGEYVKNHQSSGLHGCVLKKLAKLCCVVL